MQKISQVTVSPVDLSAVKLTRMPSSSSSTDGLHNSSVNLIRSSSHPWTKADSAAGFVLRYLVPMRRQLTSVFGTTELADEALKLLLAHLVSVGFGDHKRGRLRDFLLRGIRSAAKSSVNDIPEAERPKLDLDKVTLESKEWLTFWREGLLERAWRSLERNEHGNPDSPVYTVLNVATNNPQAKSSILATQIATECGMNLDESKVQEILVFARTMFAQLVADEVAETLEDPSSDDVKKEITQLGLGKAFSGISV